MQKAAAALNLIPISQARGETGNTKTRPHIQKAKLSQKFLAYPLLHTTSEGHQRRQPAIFKWAQNTVVFVKKGRQLTMSFIFHQSKPFLSNGVYFRVWKFMSQISQSFSLSFVLSVFPTPQQCSSFHLKILKIGFTPLTLLCIYNEFLYMV